MFYLFLGMCLWAIVCYLLFIGFISVLLDCYGSCGLLSVWGCSGLICGVYFAAVSYVCRFRLMCVGFDLLLGGFWNLIVHCVDAGWGVFVLICLVLLLGFIAV